MARLPMLHLPGFPKNVIQRGNNRLVSFFNDKDYIVYLDKLNLKGKGSSIGFAKKRMFDNMNEMLEYYF